MGQAPKCQLCQIPFDEKCLFEIKARKETEKLKDAEAYALQDLDPIPWTMQICMASLPLVAVGLYGGVQVAMTSLTPDPHQLMPPYDRGNIVRSVTIGVIGFLAVAYLVISTMRRHRPHWF